LPVKNLSSLSVYWSASLFSIVIHRALLLLSVAPLRSSYVLSDCLPRGCLYTITSAQYSAVFVSVSFLQRDSERLQSRHGGHQANLLQRQRLMKFTLIDKSVAISWHPIRRVTVLSLHIKLNYFIFIFDRSTRVQCIKKVINGDQCPPAVLHKLYIIFCIG
jgi:hypothetical protein